MPRIDTPPTSKGPRASAADASASSARARPASTASDRAVGAARGSSRPVPSPSSGYGAIEAALTEARTLRRSLGPEGTEKLLTPHAVARAERASAALDPRDRARLARVLDPLTPVGRGLVLRAVAARVDRLLDADTQPLALARIQRFAARLDNLDDRTILTQATSLDLDSTRNTSARDPLEFWARRGVIHDPSSPDDDPNNDGLFQRFTGSCGSTVLQMAMAEADPLLAFALHDAELNSDDITGPIARFQREVLEEHGGVALGRREAQLRSRLRNALGRLSGQGAPKPQRVGAGDKRDLLRWALEGKGRKRDVEPTIAKLREAFDGFPTHDDLTRLRAERHPPSDEGISTAEYLKAMANHLTPLTGVSYTSSNPPEGFARGQVYRHLDQVERCLRQGLDVPFGISEPAHWMLMSAVRGRAPNRRFLVSDPDGGRTTWVGEDDVRSGEFARDPFLLPSDDERPYVDCFIFPSVDEGGPRSALDLRTGR